MSTVYVTPSQLREIADSLESDPSNIRTLETVNGNYVDLINPEGDNA